MLEAEPRPLSLLKSTSLSLDKYLGVGIQWQFRSLRVLITQPAPLQEPLLPGLFVFAVMAKPAAQACDGSGGFQYLTDQILVLRIKEIETLPEAGTRELKLCEKLWPHAHPTLEDSIGIIACEVLGAYDMTQTMHGQPAFSNTVNLNDVVQHIHVFHADRSAMETMVNGTVNPQARIHFGLVRAGEDKSYLKLPHEAYISMMDIRGKRTAMFGKTRLGKSNVVKLIVQGMLEVTAHNPDVGQIIFDVNGEYANTNPQDGESAIATAYQDRCLPYFLKQTEGNPNAQLLRFNFYERPQDAYEVIKELLPAEVSMQDGLRNLFTCKLPRIERFQNEHEAMFLRRMRKVMLYWAILDSAGFENDSNRLRDGLLSLGLTLPFNPGFTSNLRKAAYMAQTKLPPPTLPHNFQTLSYEMRIVAEFALHYPNDPSLIGGGQFVFDDDELIMCRFLNGELGEGPDMLRPCLEFHSPTATDFTSDIIRGLNDAKTIIINLGSANEQIIRYFAKSICLSIFHEQERKFVSNQLHGRYVQIYFEEAHMIFPPNSGNVIDVYSRFAKEGAKFNIGIVYSTQSPTTINSDLLSQTENFFIGHLSSQTEADYLSTVQSAFKGCQESIMRNRTPGLMQVLTYSHRYVVSIQAHRYMGLECFSLPPQIQGYA